MALLDDYFELYDLRVEVVASEFIWRRLPAAALPWSARG